MAVPTYLRYIFLKVHGAYLPCTILNLILFVFDEGTLVLAAFIENVLGVGEW